MAIARSLAALVFLSAPPLAQSFNFPSFPSSACLLLNCNALVTGCVLRVTPAAPSQRGSVRYP